MFSILTNSNGIYIYWVSGIFHIYQNKSFCDPLYFCNFYLKNILLYIICLHFCCPMSIIPTFVYIVYIRDLLSTYIQSLLFCDPLYVIPLYPCTHICVYCVLYQGSAAQTRLSGTGTVMGSSISTHCTSFSPQVRK